MLFVSCEKSSENNTDEQNLPTSVSEIGTAKSIANNPTTQELQNNEVVSVCSGQTAFYIGYRQVNSNNKNPVVLRYDNNELTWEYASYETSGDDGTGYGLLWDGQDRLYAVFSATGTQGDAQDDYRRFMANGWLESYGAGGGPKIAVIAQLDANTGAPKTGTFLGAQKKDGKSNSLLVTRLNLYDDYTIGIQADSWYSPRKTDKKPFSCSGDSPFDYYIHLSSDLKTALEAHADGCQ